MRLSRIKGWSNSGVGFLWGVNGVLRGGQYGNQAGRLKQRADVGLRYSTNYVGFR